MTSTEQRVARGVAWLDHVAPDWREHVDAEFLRMEEQCSCVCGQVFAAIVDARLEQDVEPVVESGYQYAMMLAQSERTARGDERWAIEHGFVIDHRVYWREAVIQWDALERAWLQEITGDPFIGEPREAAIEQAYA